MADEWKVAFEPGKYIIIGCGEWSDKANKPRMICMIPNGGDNDLEPEREQARHDNAEIIVNCVNAVRKAAYACGTTPERLVEYLVSDEMSNDTQFGWWDECDIEDKEADDAGQ